MIFVFCIYIPEERTLSCWLLGIDDLKLIIDVLGVAVNVVAVVIVVAVVADVDVVVVIVAVDVAVAVAVAVAAVVFVGDDISSSVTFKAIDDSLSKYKVMICLTAQVPVIYILLDISLLVAFTLYERGSCGWIIVSSW